MHWMRILLPFDEAEMAEVLHACWAKLNAQTSIVEWRRRRRHLLGKPVPFLTGKGA
jgi:hypothetical protein